MVEFAVQIFTRNVTHLLGEIAPVRKIQVSIKFVPWLSNETNNRMQERDYAHLRASENKNNYDISDYKNLRNRVNNRLKKEKNN